MLEWAPTSQHGPFAEASGLLSQAVQLATVCRSWRRAAADAVSVNHLKPRSNLPPQCLSSLLGSLVAGCNTVKLSLPLLAAPTVPRFLEIAQPPQLLVGDTWPYVSSSPQHNAAVGGALARCTSVRALRCPDQLLPPTWPPGLQDLTTGCLYHPRPDERLRRASSLLHSLQGLPCLARLTLRHFGGLEAVLAQPDCFAGLSALRQLTVHLHCLSDTQPDSLPSLSALASRGVCVGVHLEQLWPASQDSGGPRQALWTALAQCCHLNRLQVRVDTHLGVSASAAEQQLMAAITCSELVLHATMYNSPSHIEALLSIRCEHLYCGLSSVREESLDCSLLTAHPGIYVLDSDTLTRIACWPTTPPAFVEGWAVVLRRRSSDMREDLRRACFVPGPRGRLVWRNSNVSDAMLDRAYKHI